MIEALVVWGIACIEFRFLMGCGMKLLQNLAVLLFTLWYLLPESSRQTSQWWTYEQSLMML